MTKEKKNILVILDAHALIHRSYHALPSFTSPSGEPMGAVYGVSVVLLKLIRELEPTHIAAAFDREEPTFRHIAYENYKATRTQTKSDLVPQFDKTKEVFKAFGIPIYEVPGFEADDIIGTLVERFKKEKNLTIIIASGDMDTLQLVDGKRVEVYTLRKGLEDTIIYDEEKVRERFGFAPALIVDFKGLKGDPSDNIIGVKGIGEKTATEIIQHYGTIDEMYKKLKKEKETPVWMKERIRNLLLENEEEALFSKELATMRLDVPVTSSLEDLEWRGMHAENVRKIFQRFNFSSLVARIPKDAKETKPASEIKHLADTSLQTNEVALLVKNGELFACDGRNVFSVTKDQSAMLAGKEIIAADSKAVYNFLGLSFPVRFDLTLASWVCDSDQRIFALEDINETFALERKYRARIEKENLSDIYYNFELPLAPVLVLMEETGILIDKEALGVIKKKVDKELATLKAKILSVSQEQFDINSPKQLSHILFEVLKLPTKGIKKTGTRAVSTQFSELAKLRGEHPIIEFLIRYRELAKLLSTYISVLPDLAAADGRIHTTFNQTGTSTGRLSSSNPNLQNIPIRTELGKEIRRAFVADKGFELVSFDYSQVELRIAAALSGEEKLITFFSEGNDVHSRTAAEIFHVKLGDVTSEMRRRAKTINFGILYGMGARALAHSIGVSQEEAECYLEEYSREFPGIDEYRMRVVDAGRREGYVETLFGRRRYLPNLRSSFDFVRKEAERMAFNAPIQGTSADLIKRAMVEISRELNISRGNEDIKMLLQVHDELVFEIRAKEIAAYAQKIRKIMERAPELKIPIIVDAKSGPNWHSMKAI